MAADAHFRRRVLKLVPQQPPFRFIDTIRSLSKERIVGVYRFREGESFYPGHFPGRPVTPGVILIEAMAQTGLVALSIARLLWQGHTGAAIENRHLLFTTADQVEFLQPVLPGDLVISTGELVYFRRGVMRSRVWMTRLDGQPVCRGELTGMGVKSDEA